MIQICRLLILVTWAFYPIAYAIYGDSLPGAVPGIIRQTGISGLGVVGVQIGYAIADITAKAGFGMLIYYIALTKSELDPEFAKGKEIHIHVPEGAIPKDGPSAGLTMTIALLSAVSGRPVRGDVAMTGEITLHGDVLPVGGLAEKLLAAKRAGIQMVILPKENAKDLPDLRPSIVDGLDIRFVEHVEQAVELAFREPLRAPESRMGTSSAA
jgi:hypothetical protein